MRKINLKTAGFLLPILTLSVFLFTSASGNTLSERLPIVGSSIVDDLSKHVTKGNGLFRSKSSSISPYAIMGRAVSLGSSIYDSYLWYSGGGSSLLGEGVLEGYEEYKENKMEDLEEKFQNHLWGMDIGPEDLALELQVRDKSGSITEIESGQKYLRDMQDAIRANDDPTESEFYLSLEELHKKMKEQYEQEGITKEANQAFKESMGIIEAGNEQHVEKADKILNGDEEYYGDTYGNRKANIIDMLFTEEGLGSFSDDDEIFGRIYPPSKSSENKIVELPNGIFKIGAGEGEVQHDQRPTDREYALMSNSAYKGNHKLGDSLDGNDKNLCEWKVYKVYKYKKEEKKSYYGVVFKNDRTRQFVMAHKGTSTLKDFLEDIEGIVFSRLSPYKKKVYDFVREMVEVAREEEYNLSFTGHSLGAFLAEVSVFYCHNNFNYPETNAVTFESPGSWESIEKLQSNLGNNRVSLENMDIVGYVAYPNMINAYNHHVGNLYIIKALELEWSKWKLGDYLRNDHSLNNFVKYLNDKHSKGENTESLFGYLLDWPVSIGQMKSFYEEYGEWKDKVLNLAGSSNLFHSDFKAHYRAQNNYNSQLTLPLVHFRKDMQEFLTVLWDQVKDYGNNHDSDDWEEFIDGLRDRESLPDEFIEYLTNFRLEPIIKGEKRLVVHLKEKLSDKNINIHQFRSELSKYLHDFPDAAKNLYQEAKNAAVKKSDPKSLFSSRKYIKLLRSLLKKKQEAIKKPSGRVNQSTDILLSKSTQSTVSEELEAMKAFFLVSSQLQDKTDRSVALFRKDLGITYLLLKDFVRAKENLIKAMNFFRRPLAATKTNDKTELQAVLKYLVAEDKKHLAEILKYLGEIQEKHPAEAIKFSQEALQVYENLENKLMMRSEKELKKKQEKVKGKINNNLMKELLDELGKLGEKLTEMRKPKEKMKRLKKEMKDLKNDMQKELDDKAKKNLQNKIMHKAGESRKLRKELRELRKKSRESKLLVNKSVSKLVGELKQKKVLEKELKELKKELERLSMVDFVDNIVEIYFDIVGAWFYYQEKGVEKVVRKQIEHAEKIVDLLLVVDKARKLTSQQRAELSSAYVSLGYFYYSTRGFDNGDESSKAEAKFIESIKYLDADDVYNVPNSYSAYGMFLYQEGKYKEAIKQFENVVALLKKELKDGRSGCVLIPLGISDRNILDSDLFDDSKKILDENEGTAGFDAGMMAYYYLVKCCRELKEFGKMREVLNGMTEYGKILKENYDNEKDEMQLAKKMYNSGLELSGLKLLDRNSQSSSQAVKKPMSTKTKVQKGRGIGPKEIKDWELHDVKGDGNCFYRAAAHQLQQLNHQFINQVPRGTEPYDSLRLRIQGLRFTDGEWADYEEIMLLAEELQVVVAIVDTRNPLSGYIYHYVDDAGRRQYTNDASKLPKLPIVKLAYTGNHYLSVEKDNI